MKLIDCLNYSPVLTFAALTAFATSLQQNRNLMTLLSYIISRSLIIQWCESLCSTAVTISVAATCVDSVNVRRSDVVTGRDIDIVRIMSDI
jgi:hypothetical protein